MLLKDKVRRHRVRGERLCDNCWTGYFAHCVCGGLIHNEYESAYEVDDCILNYECDQCGDEWDFGKQVQNGQP